MRNIPFALRVGPVGNAYTDLSGRLVLLRGASLPDVCIVCGSPAWGNLYHKEFEPHCYPSWDLPLLWDVIYLILGKRYLMDLPFCSNCQPDDFQIYLVRINNDFAVLSDVSGTFLKSLPSLPLDLSAKVEGNLVQRALRLFFG